MSAPGGKSKFIHKSSAKLEEFLRWDFHSPDGGSAAPEELLEAARILSERDGFAAGEAERAWERFRKKYAPWLTDGRSLYADDQEEDYPASVQTPAPPPGRRSKLLLRSMCAAAALIAVALAAATTATATTGLNLWGVLFERREETIQFAPGQIPYTPPEDVIYPETKEFADIQQAVEAYGFSQRVLPRWLPEGFEQQMLYADDSSCELMFHAFYQRGDDTLIVGCNTVTDPQLAGRETHFQTDERDPDVYVAADRPYFLTTNAARLVALWIDGSMECYISGNLTSSELTHMIDSLYEEQ